MARHLRAVRARLSAGPAQRTPLARLLPPRLVPARAAGDLGGDRGAPAWRNADGPAHRADRDPRRDRRRCRGERREPGARHQERVRGRRRAGRRAAHQLAGRQPGAGRHHQRRDPAPEGAAQEEGLRGRRRDLRVGRLLHRGRRRRDLRRQGLGHRLDRRADGRLRLHRHDGQARRRTAPDHGRREQGHRRPVLAADAGPARLHPGHARPDPPAVHRASCARAAASG